MKKTLDENFRDWESDTFGFGYGSGEQYTIPVLKKFFDLCPESGCYDYELLENELTPTVAWLLINILCKADILEYGTSPHGAWFHHDQGVALKRYIDSKTVDELFSVIDFHEDYTPCYPKTCNCGINGYQQGKKCNNPFWS